MPGVSAQNTMMTYQLPSLSPAGLHGRANCHRVQLRGQRGVDGGRRTAQHQRQPHTRAVADPNTRRLRLPGGQLRCVPRRAHQLLPVQAGELPLLPQLPALPQFRGSFLLPI